MYRLWCVVLLFVVSIAPAARAVDVKGFVSNPAGEGVANATICIYWLAPTEGPLNLPMVYADWGKAALSDDSGNFELTGLAEKMNFSLVVAADGFAPLQLEKIDAAAPVEARLKERPEELRDAANMIKGRVVDRQGKPVWGALVRPVAQRRDGRVRSVGGRNSNIDRLTATDKDGRYVIATAEPDVPLDLRIEGVGFSTHLATSQSPGEEVHDHGVTPGTTVRGRLLKDGKPVAGATVGATRPGERFEDVTRETLTDEKGVFTFAHLNVQVDYNFYTKMKSVGEQGAMALRAVTSPAEKEIGDMGDVALEPAFAVKGRVRVAEGETLELKDARVLLRRMKAVDSLNVPIDAEGRFAIVGVPAGEEVQMTLTVPGYELSGENVSADPVYHTRMVGIVDANLELDILLQKVDEQRRVDAGYMDRRRQLQALRLEGVPAQGK